MPAVTNKNIFIQPRLEFGSSPYTRTAPEIRGQIFEVRECRSKDRASLLAEHPAATYRPSFMKSFLRVLFIFVSTLALHAADKPIKALIITGGCCHNYTFQSQAITQAIA